MDDHICYYFSINLSIVILKFFMKEYPCDRYFLNEETLL